MVKMFKSWIRTIRETVGWPRPESRVQQNGKVAYFVWDLVQKNADGGDYADFGRHQESSPHRKSMTEVVDAVGQEVEVTAHTYLGALFAITWGV